ncbi:helix-turn-helix transcriptional regulator [Ornithinibacillus salinisoli]|uniref:Helix-turn-helix transcriptional regulator n=1 Tax=Ornithinibacillus salinisoli TaxID=1848459 RepID=A0ABW4W652_9BACI
MHWELIKLRKSNKISQGQMAKYLNINPSTYSKKENGHYDFKLEEIYKIARFFNKRIDDIFLPTNIRNTDIRESRCDHASTN